MLCRKRSAKPAGIIAFSAQRCGNPPGSGERSSMAQDCCTYLSESQTKATERRMHSTWETTSTRSWFLSENFA